MNLGTIIALSSGKPMPDLLSGSVPALKGLATCMGFVTVSMLCSGSVLLGFAPALERFRRRNHNSRPHAAAHKMMARPRPSMRPAHQGKLLPDAAGAVYTVHVAVLLMTVRLKLSLVPGMSTRNVTEHVSNENEKALKCSSLTVSYGEETCLQMWHA